MKMVSNCIICLCRSSSVIFPHTRSLQSSSTNLQNLAFIVTIDGNMPIFFFGTFYTQHVTGNYKTVTVTHLDRTGIANELAMEYFGLSHDLDIITNRVYNINGVCVLKFQRSQSVDRGLFGSPRIDYVPLKISMDCDP